MKTTYTDETWSLYPKTGGGVGFRVIHTDSSREIEGRTETAHGIVICRSFEYGNRIIGSSLEIIKDGEIKCRRFNKAFSQRGLVTKAKQFANEIFGDYKC